MLFLQFDVLGVVLDTYCIADFLEDGVVDDARTLIARGACVIEYNALVAVGIDDVVLDQATEVGAAAERLIRSPWMPTELE